MKTSELNYNLVSVFLDYLMVVAAALAAYYLRFGEAVSFIKPVVYELPLQNFLYLVFFGAVVMIAVFAWLGLYRLRIQRRLSKEVTKVFLGCTTTIMIVIVLIFLQRDLFSSRFIILFSWFFSIVFVTLGRVLLRMVQVRLFARGVGVSHLVVVGSDKTTHDILERINEDHSLGYKLVGYFQDTNHDLLGKLQDFLKDKKIDEIIQADPDATKQETLNLLDFCNEHGIAFKYAADLLNTTATNVEVDSIAGIPTIEIKRTPLEGWGKFSKRLFDIVVSSLLIILTAPFMIFTAIAIAIESRGPIFFSRLPDGRPVQRVGQYGKFFHYFKFRSMFDGAHKLRFDPEFLSKVKNLREGTPMMKFENDPRVTKVGRFIRRLSLDELPEFFMVFIGRMSLVGPRPHYPEEVEKYKKHHRKALSIKPGITGLAQISGRSDLSFEDEVRLDTYYIENWSLGRDILIILRTPLAMLRKRSAL